MAQNFRQVKMKEIGVVAADVPDGANFDSYDCVIGINFSNITTSTITVDAYLQNGSNNYYIIKGMPIVSGGAYVYDGKLNVVSGDRLWFKSDTASSLDVIVSFVDAISS